jgi:hypothetical protein
MLHALLEEGKYREVGWRTDVMLKIDFMFVGHHLRHHPPPTSFNNSISLLVAPCLPSNFDKVFVMLSSTRSAASMALRGTTSRTISIATPTNAPLAKPTAAIVPFRTMQAAWISSSSSKGASADVHTQPPGLISQQPGGYLPSKKIRGEVPLASQEGKKGAMQYALYV